MSLEGKFTSLPVSTLSGGSSETSSLLGEEEEDRGGSDWGLGEQGLQEVPRVGLLGPHSQPVSDPGQVIALETEDVLTCKM